MAAKRKYMTAQGLTSDLILWLASSSFMIQYADLLRLFRVCQGFSETQKPSVASPLKLRSYVVTYGIDLQTLQGNFD